MHDKQIPRLHTSGCGPPRLVRRRLRVGQAGASRLSRATQRHNPAATNYEESSPFQMRNDLQRLDFGYKCLHTRTSHGRAECRGKPYCELCNE